MGFDFTKDYRLFMTDDGPRVLIDTPHKLGEEKIDLPPVELSLPFNMSRTQTIRYLKNLNLKVRTVVDHEVIITPLHQYIKDNSIELEDLKLSQLVTYGDEMYIDEFGLPVYSASVLSGKEEFIDKRYEE